MAFEEDKNYGQHQTGLDSPFAFAAGVTPSDTVDLPSPSRALYAEVGGIVRVRMLGNGAVVNLPISAGIPLPARVTRVYSTGGTTATGIVAVW